MKPNTQSCPNKNANKTKEILLSFKKIANSNLLFKHITDNTAFSIRCLNDIVYNEKAHVVSVFKDYLIYDDMSEFLKRYVD